MEADNVLTVRCASSFRSVAEAYPDLKADELYAAPVHAQDTENKVSYARQSYNDCVLSYNNAIQMFPGRYLCLHLPV